MVATVFGATGFLGRYVVSLIGEEGGRAVCPHRCDDMDMQHLRPMGDLGNIVTLENFSIRDDEFIKYSISKSNVVINLIGQNTETWNYGFKEVRTHKRAMTEGDPLSARCTHAPMSYRFTRTGLAAWPRCAQMYHQWSV